jgi:hypothetical protein
VPDYTYLLKYLRSDQTNAWAINPAAS